MKLELFSADLCLTPCGLLFCCMEPLWCSVERSCGKDTKIRPENHPQKASKNYSSEPLQRALGWTTLEKRRYKALACLVHRCLYGEAPSFLCSKFRPNTGYIRTRGANKLHLPRPKMEYFQSTFTFQGALLYNQLPENIRRLKPIRSFKAALHDHLLN